MAFLEDLLGVRSKCIIGEIRCDASTNEDHAKTGVLTEHPVEFGSDISDHYRANAPELSIEGEVSNTPLGTGFPLETAINSAALLITGGDPVENAWKELNRYFDEKVAITIETSLDIYFDMVLTSLNVRRTGESGQRLQFSLTAREITFAYTSEVEAIAAVAAATATETVQEAISEGAQTTASASAQEAANAELVAGALEAAGVII